MIKIMSLYPGTEESFYICVGIICQSCITNIDPFAAYKPKYTPAFVQAIRNAAIAASEMPNNHQRITDLVLLRTALAGSTDDCCANASLLFGYISDAFASDDADVMKKKAGLEFYKDALRYKWSSVAILNNMMASFIDSYSQPLTAAGMAEDFPATCEASATSFTENLNAYTAMKNTSKGQTSEKTEANNAVYQSLLSIMADAKIIFANDAFRRKQFIYSEVLKTVRRPGKTGFRIVVMNKTMNEPIEKAHISFTNSSATGITNKKGVVKIEMNEGTYSYMISAPGFTTQIGTVTANKYVMHRHTIELTPGSGQETAQPVVKIKSTTKEKAAQ